MQRARRTNRKMPRESKLRTRLESAGILRVSRTTVDRLIASKQLKATYIAGRVCVHVDELERFAREGSGSRRPALESTRTGN